MKQAIRFRAGLVLDRIDNALDNRVGIRPSLMDVARQAHCSVSGHRFDGQFCERCGWFYP